ESLKASGTEDTFFEQWSGQQARVANQQQHLGRLEALLAAVPDVLRMVAGSASLLVGGLLIMKGAMTLGVLVAFQQLTLSFEINSRQMFDRLLMLQKARGALDQIDDVIDQPEACEFAERTDDAPEIAAPASVLGRWRKLDGHVDVRSLTFG